MAKPKPKPEPVSKSEEGYSFYKMLPESEVVPPKSKRTNPPLNRLPI